MIDGPPAFDRTKPNMFIANRQIRFGNARACKQNDKPPQSPGCATTGTAAATRARSGAQIGIVPSAISRTHCSRALRLGLAGRWPA